MKKKRVYRKRVYTPEQLEARRAYQRAYKDRKARAMGKPKRTFKEKRVVVSDPNRVGSEAWYAALKEKHKGHEGERLERSIKPPIALRMHK